jgi:hypothetical protein
MKPVRSNPFSARYIRPGVISFIFPTAAESVDGKSDARGARLAETEASSDNDVNAERLVDRLEKLGARAEIVGPHGSGKSTLLASIIPVLGRRGAAVLDIALHDNQKRLPSEFLSEAKNLESTKAWLIIDGYEQLGQAARFRLKRLCEKKSLGRLVTTHRSQGFPLLFETGTNPDLARRIVDRMLHENSNKGARGSAEQLLSEEDVLHAFEECNGDMRETLFSLYDRYEQVSTERDELGEAQ